MLKNIFSVKKNSNIFAIFFVVGLHYLFNPSESMGAPLVAKLSRLIPIALVLVMVFFVDRPKRRTFYLFYPFFFISVWFVLINFPDNILALFTLFLFMICGLLVSAHLFCESKAQIVSKSLDFLLIFWVFSLFFQVALYLFAFQIIDLHQFFHPWSEARVHDVGLFVRFTGVLIEPGTYANWVYGVVLLRGLVNNKLFDGLSFISVLSIMMTLSAWGSIVVAIYLITYLLRGVVFSGDGNYKKKVSVIGFLVLLLVLVYSWFLVEIGDAIQYLNSRSELMDVSGASKVQAYEGFSKILLRISLVGVPIDYDFCNGCLSPQDAGVFLNMAVRGGLVFTVVVFSFIALCIYRRYGILACVCVVPLAFAKYFYFEPLFWSIFGFCFLDVIRLNSGSREGV